MDSKAWLERWHEAVEARDGKALAAFVADDIVLGAPPYWKKLEGKAVVGTLLEVLIETFEDFTYHREWIDGNDLALEFTAHIGDHKLQGVDLITLNDAGLIESLDVAIRPLNTLQELARAVGEKMQARLAQQG